MGVFNNFPYANFHELNADWIIEQVREVKNEWEEYKADMDLWKLSVDDQLAEFQAWFDNLDVQDEVRTVIHELIQSGEFIEITGPQIVSATEAWLAAHITPTTPAVDDTLSISGAAADAKVTGDRISDLKEDIDDVEGGLISGVIIPSFAWEYGNIDSSGAEANNNRTDYARTPYFSVPADCSFTYVITSSSYRFIVAKYTTAKVFIERTVYADLTNTITLEKGYLYRISVTLNDYTIVIDLSDLSSYLTCSIATFKADLLESILTLTGDVNTLNTKVNSVIETSPNMFDKNTITEGYYILKNGTVTSGYDTSFISAPIAIRKNVTYKISNPYSRIRVQDINGNLLAMVTEDTLPSSSGEFSYTADAYVVIAQAIENASSLMLCESANYPESYEPYGTTLILSIIDSEIAQSPINGKNVAWYGDSIIQNNWKDAVTLAFSMDATNCGVGGTKISGSDSASMCQATRINGQYPAQTDPNTGVVTQPVAVPNDAEIIIIGGGTNDWAQNVPLGEKQVQFNGSTIVEDVTTFYQACHCMFRRFHEERPNAKIIVLGTPFALYTNRFTNAYGLLNNLGLSTLDYGKALCDVARMWGYFALDYGEYMGINESNVASLLNPGSDGHLHPSIDTSKEMFARCTIQRLTTIKYLY